MSDRAEKAVATFSEGYNCAQAVLAQWSEELDVSRRDALRLAAALGGGMGGMGEVCGAVAGALLVIGLKHGSDVPRDLPMKQKVTDLVQEFARRFRQRNRSILCRDLLGCDIVTPEQQAQAREKGLFRDICPRMVRDAAEVLEALLAETERRPDDGCEGNT